MRQHSKKFILAAIRSFEFFFCTSAFLDGSGKHEPCHRHDAHEHLEKYQALLYIAGGKRAEAVKGTHDGSRACRHTCERDPHGAKPESGPDDDWKDSVLQ